MLKENLFKAFCVGLLSLLFCLVSSNEVDAAYKFCSEKIANTEYYDCGNYIYTYYEDPAHSSIVYAADENASIIYAGELNGTSIFYASGIRFYNRSYDDTSKVNKDLWTIASTRGTVVYDGSFKDSWLLDDSHEGFYYYTLKRDVYAFTQYVNGELYRTIAVYNINKDSIDINSVEYDDFPLYEYSQEVLEAKKGITAKISAKYGGKSIVAKINDEIVNSSFDGVNVYISPEDINRHLIEGEESILEITAYNYFYGKCVNKYKFKLVNDSVSINFHTMSSVIESSSRRILINAIAGKGKTIDTDYCWYYWSTNDDDSLEYDSFLKNYANSSYKGSYSEGKGVILRNTTGTYYLYALAKDDDSWVVEKSEGYTLNNIHPLPTYDRTDYFIIVLLIVVAIVPIVSYLIIRKKGH